MTIICGTVTIAIRAGGDEATEWNLTRLIGAAAGRRDARGRAYLAFPKPFAGLRVMDGEDLAADPEKRARVCTAIEFFVLRPVGEQAVHSWH